MRLGNKIINKNAFICFLTPKFKESFTNETTCLLVLIYVDSVVYGLMNQNLNEFFIKISNLYNVWYIRARLFVLVYKPRFINEYIF